MARRQDLADALVEELGAPARLAFDHQAGIGALHLQTAIATLKDYPFERMASDRTRVQLEPIGVVGIITPWNWPINQIICKIAPALATGNTLVHKPSEVAPFTGHIIAEILHEAGVPKGVYNLVDGTGPDVGVAISSHPGIAMVSFTGSTRAGIDVAQRAAETVKRVHQELGGKSPNVVLPSADLVKAVTENVQRLIRNSGQTCHAPTRMIVPADRLDEVKQVAAKVAASIKVGDPNSDVDMGPLVSRQQYERVSHLIQSGIDEGATLVAGGTGRPAGWKRGSSSAQRSLPIRPATWRSSGKKSLVQCWSFRPIRPSTRRWRSPTTRSTAWVAYVQAGTDAEAADVAARIESGMVYLNGAFEDPTAPFGGYKMSGNGREWGRTRLPATFWRQRPSFTATLPDVPSAGRRSHCARPPALFFTKPPYSLSTDTIVQ